MPGVGLPSGERLEIMNPNFPSQYRGVRLTPEEQDVIADFLREMLGSVPEEQRQWIEHLFVADALCMYASALVEQARAEGSAPLAQAACESVERASLIASDEPIYVYRLARCLDRAGAVKNAIDYYQIFLNRSASDVGALGRSPLESSDFQNAVAYAKQRIGMP
jgi:hypothetical protein